MARHTHIENIVCHSTVNSGYFKSALLVGWFIRYVTEHTHMWNLNPESTEFVCKIYGD